METSTSEKISPPLPPFRPGDPKSTNGFQTYLLLFVVAIALGVFLKSALPLVVQAKLRSPDVGRVTDVLTLLAALATSIVLHEAGHLVTALLVNFEIISVTLGPFRTTRSAGRWRCKFTPRTFFSGSVSAVPRDFKHWQRNMLLVIAAGPVATLVSGLAAFGLLWVHANLDLANLFLNGFTQLSLFIFILGLIPNDQRARVRNDARLVAVLIHNSEAAREIRLYHQVTRLELDGMRPRDYPEKLLAELAGLNGRPELMLHSAHRIVLWALDCGQMRTAEAWDQRCLALSERCMWPARNLALAHSACLDILIGNQPQAAAAKFAALDWQALSPAWLLHRVRATYYLATQQVPECLAEIACAQHSFPNKLPVYVFERDLLTQLHRRALAVRPPELAKSCAA